MINEYPAWFRRMGFFRIAVVAVFLQAATGIAQTAEEGADDPADTESLCTLALFRERGGQRGRGGGGALWRLTDEADMAPTCATILLMVKKKLG